MPRSHPWVSRSSTFVCLNPGRWDAIGQRRGGRPKAGSGSPTPALGEYTERYHELSRFMPRCTITPTYPNRAAIATLNTSQKMSIPSVQPARQAIVQVCPPNLSPERCPTPTVQSGRPQSRFPTTEMACQLVPTDVEEPTAIHIGYLTRIAKPQWSSLSTKSRTAVPANHERHNEGDEHKRVGVFRPNALEPGLSDEFTRAPRSINFR